MIVLLALSVNHAAAQGIVYFGNQFLPDPPDRLVRDSSGEPLVGANFVAQLLYETTANSFTAHTTTAPFFQSAAFRGWWQGGNRTLTGAGGVDIPVRMQIRVWDAGFGGTPLTFDEAMAAGRQFGSSEIFTYTQHFSGAPSLTDTLMVDFRGFQLVPEPSTWVLLAFGAGVLFWKWRHS